MTSKESSKKSIQSTKKVVASSCDDCVFYDYDEDYDEYYCRMNLDEDEMVKFLSSQNNSCPYYRYYDEYKSVHKQI